jgi:hypothetical protein
MLEQMEPLCVGTRVRHTAALVAVNPTLALVRGMVMGVGHRPEVLHVRCRGQKRPQVWNRYDWERDPDA